MARILHIEASPRGDRSFSTRLGREFIEEYRRLRPEAECETLNLFSAELPPFEAYAAAAKYRVISGQSPQDAEAKAWGRVIDVIDRFKAADLYVISSPMWNFGIPYRLKHYLDLIVQPGLTFSFSPDAGYNGLLTGRRAVLALARGSDYSAPGMSAVDMQRPHVEAILRFIGLTDIDTLVVEPTIPAEGGDTKAVRAAMETASKLAQKLAK